MTLPIIAKAAALGLLLVILVSLASGLYYLIKDGGESKRTVRALTLRITLSLLLFGLLIVALGTGLIAPTGPTP